MKDGMKEGLREGGGNELRVSQYAVVLMKTELILKKKHFHGEKQATSSSMRTKIHKYAANARSYTMIT